MICGIPTWIARVEENDIDHFTATTAQTDTSESNHPGADLKNIFFVVDFTPLKNFDCKILSNFQIRVDLW